MTSSRTLRFVFAAVVAYWLAGLATIATHVARAVAACF